jgi:hypothetical protein
MRKFFFLIALALSAVPARPAFSQTPQATSISGYVNDSIAHTSLADATVQLISATDPAFLKTATSDSNGHFIITDVPPGKYKLGFLHPVLDSLGVEAPLREVNVDSARPVAADLAIPSASRLRVAICGKPATTDSGAVIVGAVRDAKTGAPIQGAAVSGEWIEMVLNRGGFVRRLARRTATTSETGWFALCDVPGSGSVALTAIHGNDSTTSIETQIPSEGFARSELYIGNVGDGRVSGTIRSVAGDLPIPGATVGIVNGPQAKTDENGKFSIANAPSGTRMLEIRALGFYPERRYVNVVSNAAPVSISLKTLSAVLDTVKIMAKRLPNGPDDGGFLQRRRMSQGKFITQQDMLRFPVTNVSDVFRRIPGLRYSLDQYGQPIVQMRGAFAEYCEPQIYLDGRNMTTIGGSTADIDDWVNPKEVRGIEVYSEATTPSQFTEGLHGCGAIVIWTR